MIADFLEYADLYRLEQVNPNFREAFDYLKTLTPENAAKSAFGKNGDKVFAKVYTFDGVTKEGEPTFEAHREYADVQYVVKGREVFGWAHRSDFSGVDYNQEKDCLFFPMQDYATVPVSAGGFVVFFPNDAHVSGFRNEPGEIIKVVVKVKL